MHEPRILLHLSRDLRQAIDPADIYFLEAAGDDTRVRLREQRRLVDVRPLSEFFPIVEPFGFVRIHRDYAVNLQHVREARGKDGRGWELRLQPPVNRVLPIARSHEQELWKAFGERPEPAPKGLKESAGEA